MVNETGECERREAVKMLTYRGPESLNMLILLIVTLIVAQLIMLEWKRRHPSSYQLITFLEMWLVPFAIFLCNFCIVSLLCWLIVSCGTASMIREALKTSILQGTSRNMCKRFLCIYSYYYVLILFSLIMIGGYYGSCYVCSIFNVTDRPKQFVIIPLLIRILCYGIYFGALSRDVGGVFITTMVSRIGYYIPDQISIKAVESNICSVCGNEVLDSERGCKLNCLHVFHNSCIKAWCIVGKQQRCPYCKEKVDFRQITWNLLERTDCFPRCLMGFARYLVALQPLIVLAVIGINRTLVVD